MVLIERENLLKDELDVGRRNGTAVVDAFRLVDDEERGIFGRIARIESHERGNVFPLRNLSVFEFLRRSGLASHLCTLDIRLLAASVRDDVTSIAEICLLVRSEITCRLTEGSMISTILPSLLDTCSSRCGWTRYPPLMTAQAAVIS